MSEEDVRLTALFLWTHQSTGSVGANSGEDDDVASTAAGGLALPFDVVRRFAQPMGIDLDRWTGRVIGQSEGVVRLLPVAERARDLFGAAGADAVAGWIEMDSSDSLQGSLFPESRPLRPRDGRIAVGGDAGNPVADTTVLDRVHAQADGHSQALRALIEAEQV